MIWLSIIDFFITLSFIINIISYRILYNFIIITLDLHYHPVSSPHPSLFIFSNSYMLFTFVTPSVFNIFHFTFLTSAFDQQIFRQVKSQLSFNNITFLFFPELRYFPIVSYQIKLSSRRFSGKTNKKKVGKGKMSSSVKYSCDLQFPGDKEDKNLH